MTGYERANGDSKYHFVDALAIHSDYESYHPIDIKLYENANYYSDKTVAESNARADKLMRQLRRFSVENRKHEIDWPSGNGFNWEIYYDYKNGKVTTCAYYSNRRLGVVYFDTKETAKKAIEQFHDELIWYFTEYKDSCGLPEQKEQAESDIQKFSTDELLEELKRRTESEE